MFQFRSRLSKNPWRQEQQDWADEGGCGNAVLKVRQRETDHLMRTRPTALRGRRASRPVWRRCSNSGVRHEKAAAPREEEGRRRVTLAQGGGRGRVWVRQGQGGGEACRGRTDLHGGGGVRRIVVPQMGRLYGGGILWQKNATSPGPGRRRPERVVLTSCPRPLHGPGG